MPPAAMRHTIEQDHVRRFSAAKISATGEVTPVNPGPVLKKGDLNLDTHVNAADLTAMLSALTDRAAFEASHALNDDKLFTIGDMDGDGSSPTSICKE